MLNEFLQNNDKAKFIFKNYEFLEVHVSRTIQKIEGPIFSADKTQYIISELLNFFIFENRLEHNWSQPHTFHLPKLVFQNHKDIENYFDALYFLHAGMPSRYIDIYAALAERFPCLIDP